MCEIKPIKIRPVVLQDYDAWSQLYAAYAGFYKVAQTPAMREQAWQWIYQAQPEISALVAVDPHDRLLGFLHYRTFVRPLAAAIGGYVDDLFVVPEARGQGIAQQLIACVVEIGKAKQWSVVRWMTALDNQQARICYDKIAEHTHWQTYEIKLVK